MSSSSSTDQDVFALTNFGMRRSCLECGERKKKCDGLRPCSRCLENGVRCTYSKRKWHQPGPGHQPRHHPRGPAAMPAARQSTDSSSGALLACDTLPLKRFRLSASPATGLVGMQENAFLSDFFGCVGLLPLTTPSHVRGAMVRMMTGPAAQQQLSALHDSPDQGQFCAIFTEDGITTGSQLSTGPSCCTFWCAVGVGALVKGSPVESVANYSRLARGALDAYTGAVNAEVAEAWTILGYLLGWMGDMAKYKEYLELSGSFWATSIEQGSTETMPPGFAEMTDQVVNVKTYSGDLDTADVDSLVARHQHPPKINPAACEWDIYRYVAQYFNAMMLLAFESACENNTTIRPSGDDEPFEEDRGGASPYGNVPQAEEVSDAFVAGLNADLIAFDHLQAVADRPNIRTGIVGLLINMSLGLQKAAKGDTDGALERFGYCVEMFELYPGICRCELHWGHMSHGVLGFLAAIDDPRARGQYARLREVHNLSRSSASLPAPPWGEWHGMSAFCGTFQCSLYGGLITAIAGQGLGVFSNMPHHTTNCIVLRQADCTDNNLQAAGEAHKSNNVSAGVTPENPTGSIMDARCSNSGEPTASPSLWESHQEPAPQTSRPPRSSSSTSHVHPGLGRGGASDSGVLNSAVDRGDGGGALFGLVPRVSDVCSTLPESTEVDWATEATEDNPVAAADWLDVTHAMLGELDGKSPER